MHRYLRITLVALTLVLLGVGSALANGSRAADEHRSPMAASHRPSPKAEPPGKDASEADEATALTAQELDRLVGLLDKAGIVATSDQIAALAASYGVGGAVRILAWADAMGDDTATITDLRDQGMGWGAIARQLSTEDGSVTLTPGIGAIMSGSGQGHAHADGAAGNANGKAKGKATAPGQSGN